MKIIRALIVEDNEDVAIMLKLWLETYKTPLLSFIAEIRGSLAAGIEAVNSSLLLDVILFDLHLPDGEGLEAFRRIYGAAQHLPIVVITGEESEAVEEAVLSSGAQDYLRKPLAGGGKQLVEKLLHAVIKHRAIAAASKYYDAVFKALDEAEVVAADMGKLSPEKVDTEKADTAAALIQTAAEEALKVIREAERKARDVVTAAAKLKDSGEHKKP